MFTGIIEALGQVREVNEQADLVTYRLSAPIASELRLGESISHNGICLTVAACDPAGYEVQVITSTLQTAAARWAHNDVINLERAMPASGRFDGHVVSGHIDCTGRVLDIVLDGNIRLLTIGFDTVFSRYIIPKGSICLQGISLTVANLSHDRFTVAIIPHTWQVTNLQQLKLGDPVNLEFDIMGKYALRYLEATDLKAVK